MAEAKQRRTREGNDAELRACAECTAICTSIHRRKSDFYPSVARFFKVLLGKDWKKFLLVPPTFAATVTDLVGKKTELENANGEKWTVTLSSCHQGYAFQMGWEDFVVDHNLTIGDFLVFNYIKGSHFMVQIYGRNGCEKNCIGSRRSQFRGNATAQAKPCEEKRMDTMKRSSLSTSVSPGTKADPSATNRTQDSGNRTRDSGGDNVKLPSSDSGMCHFGVHGSKKSIEAGVGTSSPVHTGMGWQAEANKDFSGTENFESNIFTKLTDVSMSNKDKAFEFKDDRTRKRQNDPLDNLSHSAPHRACEEPGKRGDDRNSPTANEAAVLKNSGKKSTGDLKKMVEKEQQEISKQTHGLEKRTRGAGDLKTMVEKEQQERSEPARGHGKRNQGDDRNSPFANEAAILKNSGQKSTDDLKKMVEKEQEDISKQAHGHAKRTRGDLKKMAEIELLERSEPAQGRGKRKQGVDWNSPNANEGTVLKNSGQKSTGDVMKMVKKEQEEISEPAQCHANRKRGDLKKMVERERQERSEPAHGHAKRKRDLESRQHNTAYCEQVKIEPLDDVPLSDEILTCLAVTNGRYLVLPSTLPAFRSVRGHSKGVVLRDQKRRLWPAIYHERSGSYVLTCEWEKFNRENGIQAGDSYAFKFEDVSQLIFMYSIVILHQL